MEGEGEGRRREGRVCEGEGGEVWDGERGGVRERRERWPWMPPLLLLREREREDSAKWLILFYEQRAHCEDGWGKDFNRAIFASRSARTIESKQSCISSCAALS